MFEKPILKPKNPLEEVQKDTLHEVQKEILTKDEILFLSELKHLTEETAYDYLTSNQHRLTPNVASQLLTPASLQSRFEHNSSYLNYFINRFLKANLLTQAHADELLNLEFLVKVYQKDPIYLTSFINLFIRASLLTKAHADELLNLEFLVKVYQKNPNCLDDFINRFLKANLLTKAHADKLLTVEFLVKVYQKYPFKLHYFTDLNLHRLVENKEVLNEYCRYLVQYSYEYPKKAGSVFHHIVEIQSMLSNEDDVVDSNEPIPSVITGQSIESGNSNESSSNSPYISQQNIIQMQSFAKALDVKTSFDTGSMIASSIGFLGRDVKVEFVTQEEINNSEGKDLSYSPHPDFSLAKIGSNNVFAIRNFESIEFQELVKRIKLPDGTSKVFNTLKVRPLAVDSNFYHVYYQTEDNMVVRICLDMKRTEDLLNEGFEAFRDISHYFSEIFEDEEVKEKGIGERTSVSDFVDYLLVRYPGLQEYVGVQKKENTKQISWKSLLSCLEESKDTLFQEFPEAYKALVWHCTNEITLEAKSHVKNTMSRTSEAVIRLLGSKDHDHYFKICQSLLMRDSKVLAGDTLNNSHTFVFIDKMNNIKQNKPAETVTTPFLRCYLPTELQQEEEFEDYHYNVDEETINNPKNLIIYGKALKDMNSQLAFKIDLIYQEGKQISIDNKKLTKEEFQEYKLNPGDHVRVVEKKD
jgi:hypothetical protein